MIGVTKTSDNIKHIRVAADFSSIYTTPLPKKVNRIESLLHGTKRLKLRRLIASDSEMSVVTQLGRYTLPGAEHLLANNTLTMSIQHHSSSFVPPAFGTTLRVSNTKQTTKRRTGTETIKCKVVGCTKGFVKKGYYCHTHYQKSILPTTTIVVVND